MSSSAASRVGRRVVGALERASGPSDGSASAHASLRARGRRYLGAGVRRARGRRAHQRSRIASVWELQHGVLLARADACSARPGVVALAARRCWAIAAWGETRWARGFLAVARRSSRRTVGLGLGGGRHLAAARCASASRSAWPRSPRLAAYAAAPLWPVALRRRPLGIALGAAVAILALELVNRFVLVRLYPAFHSALAALALLAAPPLALALSDEPRMPRAPRRCERNQRSGSPSWACSWWPRSRQRVRRPRASRTSITSGCCCSNTVRSSATRSSSRPAWLRPPRRRRRRAAIPRGAGIAPRPASARPRAAARSIDWRGRDLLLITIDALRADHVGAYGYARPTTPRLDALAAQRRGVRARLLADAAHVVRGHVADDRQVHAPAAAAGRGRRLRHLGGAAPRPTATAPRRSIRRPSSSSIPTRFSGFEQNAARLRVRQGRVRRRRAPHRAGRATT